MDVLIPDISEWQIGADTNRLRWAGYRAVIARVCYGARLDLAMVARRDALRAEGFDVIGWYMFLRPFETAAEQVAEFASVIPHLGDHEFVVVDWEDDGANGPRPSVALRDEVLGLLDARYGRITWGYGFAAELQAYPFSGRPTWVAAYGTNEPALPHVLWQFTNGIYSSGPYSPVDFPGVGKVDGSVFHGTIDQLKNLINPVPSGFRGNTQEDRTLALGTGPDGKRTDRIRVLPDHTVEHDWTDSFDKPWAHENLGGWATSATFTYQPSRFIVEAVGQGGIIYQKVSDYTHWVQDWTAQDGAVALA